MPTDREFLKNAQLGHIGSTAAANKRTTIEDANERYITWRKDAIDVNAGDNTAEFVVGATDKDSLVKRVYYTADANVVKVGPTGSGTAQTALNIADKMLAYFQLALRGDSAIATVSAAAR